MAARSALTPWILVILWIAVIAGLGSASFQHDQTSRFIEPILRWLFPDWSDARVAALHGLVRKSAHLTEYAIAAILTYRARHLGAGSRSRAALALPFPGYEKVFRRKEERAAFIAATADLRRAHGPAEKIDILDRMTRRFGLRLEGLLRVLLHDPERALAARAAFYLGEFGQRSSIPAMLRVLRRRSGPPETVLIEALGKIGGVEAVPDIKFHLEQPELVDTCILALGRIGGPEAETVLARLEKTLAGRPAQEKRLRKVAEVRTDAFRKREQERRRRARLPFLQK